MLDVRVSGLTRTKAVLAIELNREKAVEDIVDAAVEEVLGGYEGGYAGDLEDAVRRAAEDCARSMMDRIEQMLPEIARELAGEGLARLECGGGECRMVVDRRRAEETDTFWVEAGTPEELEDYLADVVYELDAFDRIVSEVVSCALRRNSG